MHYLIDGHNLIASLPDIDLSDPDDEAKLVEKLRRWTAASAKRRVTVIFDAGLPAGVSHGLSGGPIKAIFAPNNQTADDLIIQRIGNVTNVQSYVVVTSDHAVIRVAQQRRIQVIRSQTFAQDMQREIDQRRSSGKKRSRTAESNMSPAELDEWMALFGGEPPAKPKSAAPKGKKKIRPAAPLPSVEDEDDEELQEWLRLFGYDE